MSTPGIGDPYWYQTSRGNWSMGNYGILAYEGTIEEANVEDPCFGGVNLFNHLGGIHRLFHGNCQLVPSSIWRDFFGCKPSDMIIELKWNKSAETALRQIKDKKYPDSIRDYTGSILLVGINYDEKTKAHECSIERYDKE